MADDEDGVTCQRNRSVDRGRPPPIPPRPSFTFANQRAPLPPSGNSTTQQHDVPTDTASQVTSGGVKIVDDVDSGKAPVPPPRLKSKKSTDDLSAVETPVDVTCDNLPSSAAVSDEVFLTCEDAQTEGTESALEGVETGLEGTETGLAVCTDSEVEVCWRGDDERVNSETAFTEACNVPECELPHCESTDATTEQATDKDLTGCILSQVTITTSTDTGASEQLPDDVGTGLVVADGIDMSLPASAEELNDASEHRVEAEVIEASERTVSDDQSSRSSLLARPQMSPRAPVARFSEFDDFGLDPDLFRPDSLELDVPFSEQTAKFTRTPSPFYEAMLDDDETG